MPAPDTPVLPPGTLLAHDELRGVLCSGGMGTVHLAHDTALDRPVALKVLRPEVAGEPELVERFVREARAAARVSHPNLTHVHFVGTGDGRPSVILTCRCVQFRRAARTSTDMPEAAGLKPRKASAGSMQAVVRGSPDVSARERSWFHASITRSASIRRDSGRASAPFTFRRMDSQVFGSRAANKTAASIHGS